MTCTDPAAAAAAAAIAVGAPTAQICVQSLTVAVEDAEVAVEASDWC